MADVVARQDTRQRPLMARIQRLAMSPAAAAAALTAIGDTDVRDVLPSVQCPTLVGAEAAVADEIQHFLTGVRPPVVSDRVLATVLFTDIVGSTERAAELGDGAWRSLLERHDRLLVSSTVRDLIVGSGQTLTDRGEHDLKGVPGPWRIFAVAA